MATVYRHPEELGDPPTPDYSAPYDPDTFKATLDQHYKDTEAWVERLREWCRQNSRDKLAGEIVRFPIADGFAEYVVLTSSKLIHIPVFDAWQIPDAHMRGLRAADIRHMVEADRRIAQLFGKSKHDLNPPLG